LRHLRNQLNGHMPPSKLIFLALALAALSVSALSTAATIKKQALICYDREAWEAMKAAIADSNYQEMRTWLASGKCQQTTKAMKVDYLDPVQRNAALVQMPSGRTAYVFTVDLQR
jgi:hypothetical protein